jgi:hypothetical protein
VSSVTHRFIILILARAVLRIVQVWVPLLLHLICSLNMSPSTNTSDEPLTL